MHLIIGTRGNKESVELFIKELSSKYMPLPFYNKRTREVTNVAQGIHVRPFQLWEIIFPKEQKDVVLTTIFPGGIKETKIQKQGFKWIYNWILKFLPLKKIEEWDMSKKVHVAHEAVECIGFGLMDDEMIDFTDRSDSQMKKIGLDPKEEYEFEGL